MDELFEVWSSEVITDLSPHGKLLWFAAPTIVCWSLWMERKARVFDIGKVDNAKLVECAFSLIDGPLTSLFSKG